MNKLDQQFREIMKDLKMDSPSSGFSEKIMERILDPEAKVRVDVQNAYQPVISHRMLGVIALSVAGLIVYLTLTMPQSGSSFFPIWLSKAILYLDHFKLEMPDLLQVNILESLRKIPSTLYLCIGTIATIMAADLLWQRFRSIQSHYGARR